MKKYSEVCTGFDTAKKKHAVAVADVADKSLINRRLKRSISYSVQFTSRITSGGYLAARMPRCGQSH